MIMPLVEKLFFSYGRIKSTKVPPILRKTMFSQDHGLVGIKLTEFVDCVSSEFKLVDMGLYVRNREEEILLIRFQASPYGFISFIYFNETDFAINNYTCLWIELRFEIVSVEPWLSDHSEFSLNRKSHWRNRDLLWRLLSFLHWPQHHTISCQMPKGHGVIIPDYSI